MVSKVAAYLEEDVAGFRCQLTVDGDTTLSGQCPDIPNGTHTYTLKYVHTDTGVILATTVVGATMEQGQNHEITFPPLAKIDDDGDGYANVVEVANGSNPKDANSYPSDTTSPATPALLSPTTGSSTSDNTPAFDWTDVTDPSGVTYEIQVDNDSNFSSLAINQVGLTASNYTLTDSLPDGTYYWRVRARDGSGNIATDGYQGNPGGWSGSWSITISKTSDTSGLVAYYPFNGNANDESGNGYNGIVNGVTLTTDRFGNANGAYSFDGVNDYIDIGNAAALNLGAAGSSYTVAAWFKTSGNVGKYGDNIIGKATSIGNMPNPYNMILDGNNKIRFQVNSNTSVYAISSPGSYADNAWHHAVGVKDNNNLLLYLDGALVAGPTTYSIPDVRSIANTYIGSYTATPASGELFTRSIDDVRIYNRALSDAEIQSLYTAVTLASALNRPVGIAVDSTDIYWTEAGGNTIKKTGINDGTITTIASELTNPMGIAIDSTTVYWTEYLGNGLKKMSLATPASAPSVPTGVSASGGDGQASISWNPVSGATSYNIYWSTTSRVTKSTGTKISGITSTSYTHTGLTNGTTYCYVVTAVNNNGEGGVSGEVSAIPQAIPVLNVTPTSLDFGSSNTSVPVNISNGGSGTLTWSATDDQTWLTVPPTSDTTTTETDTLTVTVDRTGLVRGSDTGKISITSNGGNQYIPVTMSVSNHVPVITSSCPTTAQINAAYTCDVNATDGDGDTLTYSLATAPSGMTIDPNTGVISWTPAAGGSYSVTVSVNDGNSGFATQGFSISAGSYVSGIISANTTWTCANSPYIVTGSILVNSGVTLTIEPCVTVKFDSGKALQIDGSLIARGNSTNKIIFTSNQSTKAPGDWGYILFSDSSTDAVYDANGNYTGGSILEYCTIEYAGGASVSNNGVVRMDNAHPFINYCIIRNNVTPSNGASGIRGYNLSGTLKITNNTVSSNTASGWGGGIYISGGTVIISGNTVNNNNDGGIFTEGSAATISDNGISNNIGFGVFTRSKALLNNNIISNNDNSSAAGEWGCWSGGGLIADGGFSKTIRSNIIYGNRGNIGGGICVSSDSGDIYDNVVIENQALNGGGIVSSFYYGDASLKIYRNIIVGNTASSCGGICRYGGHLWNNLIFNNSSDNEAGAQINGNNDFTMNTIINNETTGSTNLRVIYVNGNPLFNYNNIFNNTAIYGVPYSLWNDNAQGSTNVNAENNWWGSATESQYWAYDWLDDATKGVVDYTPWDATIRTDAPILPPTGLTATAGTGQISLTWTTNQEADTAGYRVHWSTVSGFPYVNSATVWNVTNHTIPNLSPGTYYVTVTAYDTTYNAGNDDSATIVNENQTNGNESWYAVEKMVTVP